MMSAPVQYLILRRDLLTVLKWPTGALVAQACHACTALTHMFYTDSNVQQYLADIDRMRKVVLEAPDEETLVQLSQTLKDANIDHKLWIEQPENTPTCIAVKPYAKEDVQQYFKKLKLFK